MIDFRDTTLNELENLILAIGEKKFRVKQIYKWIHNGVEDFDEMTNISIGFRNKLREIGYLKNMEIAACQRSEIDGTVKYLMSLKDENVIECVLMKYSFGNTICISTQVGCSMGCSFCASTIGGKLRNLTAGEMLGQILKVQRDNGIVISNVVLMGTGEPFDNYENVIKFIGVVNSPDGLNIGMRHITISTCGIVPEIRRFADLKLQATLAISLHAPNDEIRRKLMPVAYKYTINELMEACKYYINQTNKRITFEYALINNVNDGEYNALELVKLLRGMLCHVNLIPVNNVRENQYRKSGREGIEKFKEVLTQNGIETTIRRELGSDIDAACGQLRRRHMNK